MAQGVCPKIMESSVTQYVTSGGSRICYITTTTISTQVVLSIDYSSWDPDWENTAVWDDHLRQNPCLPSLNINDPGFALLTDDPWYQTGSGSASDSSRYRRVPPNSITRGAPPPRRDLGTDGDGSVYFLEEDNVGVVDERNKSRRATPDELWEHLGILECSSTDCVDELAELGLDIHGRPTPISLDAVPTETAAARVIDPSAHDEDPESSMAASIGASVRQPRMPEATTSSEGPWMDGE